MRRSAGVFVGCLAVGLASASGTAFAAFNGSCEPGEICLWRDSSYTNSVYDVTGSISNYNNVQYFNTTTSPNDRTSSIRSRKVSDIVRVYQNNSQSGNMSCFAPGTQTSSLPNASFGNLGDNSASSHSVLAGTC